jgi:hypothetical protein
MLARHDVGEHIGPPFRPRPTNHHPFNCNIAYLGHSLDEDIRGVTGTGNELPSRPRQRVRQFILEVHAAHAAASRNRCRLPLWKIGNHRLRGD